MRPALSPRLRLLGVVFALLALLIAGRALGLGALVEPERLRAIVGGAGAFGPLLFCGLFVAASLAQIPAIVFVVVAPALFSPLVAWSLCIVASNVAVDVSFAFVRKLGGQALAEFEQPFLRRMFGTLESHPIRGVAVLRLVTIMFPPVTSALALSRVSARDHALGSFVGLLAPTTAILAAAEWLLSSR